jgi:acetylornithine/succinyldiaminopimelate/putrescine aminotransferase
MAGYTGRYYFDEMVNDYEAIPERIRAVTISRIQQASQRMFIDQIGGLGVLGGGSRSHELANQLNEQVQALWNR